MEYENELKEVIAGLSGVEAHIFGPLAELPENLSGHDCYS